MKRSVLSLMLLAGTLIQQVRAQYAPVRKWAQDFLQNTALRGAHTGISIYEPASGKYWYQYQGDKYFTPASNTKIFSLYTGLELLGDSLPGMRYAESDSVLYIKGMGDPSFLHPDYEQQLVFAQLQASGKPLVLVPAVNENTRFGPGWAWSDYADDYQPELNEWPVYGNVATIRYVNGAAYILPPALGAGAGFTWGTDTAVRSAIAGREERSDRFSLRLPVNSKDSISTVVPFITGDIAALAQRLSDTLHRTVRIGNTTTAPAWSGIRKSIASDSLFRPMMHRSDNFFAEQTLMMSSAMLWDTINTRKVIDYMLARYLKGIPHTPEWVDGSGLSRYNLFTPADFVWVLDKMYKRFPQERLWNIFPTGGQGTLRSYRPGFLHAKTGSLSGCVALSGYLTTRKGKLLIFSVLVNNHVAAGREVRQAMADFLTRIWEGY